MANIRAAQSGDFSSTATWVGGVVPGSGDVAYANTFTVTISDTRTVQAISNASGTSITAGGTFSPLNGCNLTCTATTRGIDQLPGAAQSCVSVTSLSAGSSAFINAAIAHSTNSAITTINFTSSGTLSIAGSISGPTLTESLGTVISSNGTLNVTGSITGGNTGNPAYGLRVNSGIVNITGNVQGGPAGGVGAGGYGVQVNGGTCTITGNAIGGHLGPGAINLGGTLVVNGICQSSSNTGAIGAGSASQLTYLSGPFLLGTSGNMNPVQAQSWRWASTQIPTYMEVPTSGGSTKRNLYTSDNIPSTNYPTVSNVRSGVVYGPSNENTGTLAVPSPSAVSLGVATDNTVGTAILTAANVRTAVGLASANLDTQFTNIPTNVWNALTSALTTAGSIGKLLVDNINATISSRLASSAYTSPLDAAGTRSAIGLASANLDSQLDAIPTAPENAEAVRTNLTPELNRIQNCSTVDTTAQTVQNAVSS